MKITAFYPMYYTNDIETTLHHFTDELGFKILHHIEHPGMNLYVLENNGCRVDVFNASMDDIPQNEGFYATRINVDDIDEAINKYISWGCKVAIPVISFSKTKLARLDDKNGSCIFLFQHIKTVD